MAVTAIDAPASDRPWRVPPADITWRPACAWVAGCTVMAVLALRGRADLVATAAAMFLAGLGIVVVTGWAKQPNLGQLGFMGVGAYVAASLDGWPWLLRVAGGATTAAIAAVPVGLAAARVRGLALGALTFLTGITIWSLGRTPPVMSAVGGSNSTGVLLRKPAWAGDDLAFAAVAVGIAALGLAAMLGLKRSRTGRAMSGLASSPRALLADGWDARTLVLLAFMLSAALGGCAGVILGTGYGSLSAADIDPLRAVLVYAQIAVFGVSQTAAAALTATVLAVFTVWSLPTDWLGLASGLGLVLAGTVAPAGYLGRTTGPA